MRSVEVVRYSQVPDTPWKNGLGVTRQLACHPPGAGADDFEWRISIARLDESAPFSKFPGIDRCLAVLEGEMVLDRAACDPLAMTRDSRPASFSGESASCGWVLRAPVLDLNVMYRSARWHASLKRLTGGINNTHSLAFVPQLTMVCSLLDELRLTLAGSHITLGRYDLLTASGEWRDSLQTVGSYDLYYINMYLLQGA